MINKKKIISYLYIISIFFLTLNVNAQSITLADNTRLSALENNSNILKNYFKTYDHITIHTYDGAWTKNIKLPKNGIKEGSEIFFKIDSGYPVYVHYAGETFTLSKGNRKKFTFTNNRWESKNRKNVIELYGNKTIGEIANNPVKLAQYVNQAKEVIIYIYNGSWTNNIVLPVKNIHENDKIRIEVSSTNTINIYKQGQPIIVGKPIKFDTHITLKRGDKITYIFKNGKWIHRLKNITLATPTKVGTLENNPNILKEYFKKYRHITVNTYDGVWTENIKLPTDIEEGSEIFFNINSGYPVNIYNSEKTFTLSRGTQMKFTFSNGKWDNRGESTILYGNKTLGQLNNNAHKLLQYLRQKKEVIIHFYDGSWTKNIVLPETGIKEYDRVTLYVNSSYPTNVHFSDKNVRLSRNNKLELIYRYGAWVVIDDNLRDYLNKDDIVNNIDGDFEGMFQFAQTHTIFPNGNEEKNLPHLIADRTALAIFIPKIENNNKYYIMCVYDKNNQKHIIYLNNPKNQPSTAKDENFKASLDTPDVEYNKNAWTAKIPGKFIQPGMRIEIEEKETHKATRVARIDNIDIGGASEITIYNIRVGMLVPHQKLNNNPEQNDLEGSLTLAKDFFNKVSVSKLVVANYAPMKLDKIVQPDGKVYTIESDTEGGTFLGDMRAYIAKLLISDGIDNANFGVNSTQARESGAIGRFTTILTAHRAQGNYINGFKQHGFSGGNGIVTIFDNVKNEFSHEVGHNLGLGHYPGGKENYISSKRSGWGYDVFKNIFIPNFFWNSDGYSKQYFLNYTYTRDAMGGGAPASKESKYTLYTGYSQKIIQSTLESRGVFSPSSSTGYKVWDKNTKRMIEKKGNQLRKAVKYGTRVKTILGVYNPNNAKPSYIYPLFTSNYGHVYQAKYNNEPCYLKVNFSHSPTKKYGLISAMYNNFSNYVHINVESSKNPTSASLICKINNYEKTLFSRKFSNNNPLIAPTRIITSY